MNRTFVIFILVISFFGCVYSYKSSMDWHKNWYKDYGIRDNSSLTKKESIPKLIKALDDDRPEVRSYAAERIGLFGPDARDAIDKLNYIRVNDKSGTARSFADDALKKILAGDYDDYFKDQKIKYAKQNDVKHKKSIEIQKGENGAKEKSTTTKHVKEDDKKYAKIVETQKVKTETKEKTITKKTAHLNITPANYYALIIGNNNYRYMPQLKTAINDAREIASFLEKEYGFKTKLILDGTRQDIVNSLNLYRETMSPRDNLLIYYAGHGTYDKVAGRAYWLPVDAKEDIDTEWVIVDTITSNLKRIEAKHVLIVADSCYAGTLTRRMIPKLKTVDERSRYLEKIQNKKSRTLLASGGNEPVADSGDGKHSVFAIAFLKGLREMEGKIFTAEELYIATIKEQVAGKSEQIPEYHILRNSGHDGGDFCFIRK